MSARSRSLSRRPNRRLRGVSVWLIALLVALVATIQIRSQVEVERSLVGIDSTSLAFLIDDLHRANDSLDLEVAALTKQQAALQSGSSDAADQALTAEADHLKALEGLVPVHGPGVVVIVDATGLTALDLQDAVNSLAAGGAEAVDVNNQRIVMGVPIEQLGGGVAVDGAVVRPPWTISTIGDANRLGGVADVMTQQMRTDRRVREASYRVEADLVISSVISQKPFVYAIQS